MRCSKKKRDDRVGPKIGGQNQQNNDELGPVFTGGRVHPSSAVILIAQQLGPCQRFVIRLPEKGDEGNTGRLLIQGLLPSEWAKLVIKGAVFQHRRGKLIILLGLVKPFIDEPGFRYFNRFSEE
jgi:hypothetical protein